MFDVAYGVPLVYDEAHLVLFMIGGDKHCYETEKVREVTKIQTFTKRPGGSSKYLSSLVDH